MNSGEIERLLGQLGCGRIKTRNNGWVEASCPFAPWKHAKGRDEHPSFAISVAPGGTSRYRCFGCGASGEMTIFIRYLERLSNRKYKELWYFVEQTNAPSMNDIVTKLAFGENSGLRDRVAGIIPPISMKIDKAELKVLPDELLDTFSPEFPEDVHKWLIEERGLTDGILQQWEIGWHAIKSRVSIPIRDCERNLVGVSGRAWPRTRMPKYLHSTGFRRDFYLYGEWCVTRGKPAILVEGQFDVVKLAMFGYQNVFGILGSYVSQMQIAKLSEWCPSVRILPDGDLAGRSGAEASAKQIERKLPVSVLNVPDGPDPGDYDLDLARKLLGEPA